MKQREMEDFVGFRFGPYHSSELGLKVVSTSKRYDKNLMPTPNDITGEIAGGDGQYYYGSTFKNQEFTVNIVFDGIDEPTWRKLSQILSNDKLQDLVFDELPFKTYKAKVKNKPDFKHICFFDKDANQRIYKGEGKIIFICYYPYAFGFDKYLVRAADNYYTPKKPLPRDEYYDGKYNERKPEPQRPYLINEHYNVSGNMNTPWKTGFPTLEQVRQGELYFTNPNGQQSLIVDTRAYWNNVPEWQCAAQLLVSPTLDQDGELIFLPQYSKINYYNMDTGLNNNNGLIGSRLLVYNPGDLPIDFELKLGNLSSYLRRNLNEYTFRISRYNVQRLTIEQAVDWTGLTTYIKDDNDKFKYGNKYFKIIEPQPNNLERGNCCYDDPESWNFQPYFRELGCAHPHHTYIVEPIPREKLGHFIKLFFWQNENMQETEEFLKGVDMALRYEEQYKECITEEEQYELYWETLKILFEEYELNLSEYIYNPPEFFVENSQLKYGEFEFNKSIYPSYYTYDYFDITNQDFDTIYGGEINKKFQPLEDARREYTLPLFLDSERRMLYNLNKNEDKYNFKLTKNIHNENIKRGHWFKLPPGWSLIDISPILNPDKWNGKRWIDARPFEWGNFATKYRVWYDNVYQIAAIDFLSENITQQGIEVGNTELADAGSSAYFDPANYENHQDLKTYFGSLTLGELENYMQFARWYNYDTQDIYGNTLENQNNKLKADRAELGFLKLLTNYWYINRIYDHKAVGDINEWWYYANNYIWENFPPLYWGYADLLNKAEIKYVPLFY